MPVVRVGFILGDVGWMGGPLGCGKDVDEEDVGVICFAIGHRYKHYRLEPVGVATGRVIIESW